MHKKFLAISLAAVVAVYPATAITTTVEYEIQGAEKQVWTYDESTMTFSGPDAITGAFTLDEDTGVLCGKVESQEICVTFEEMSREVGHSTPFSTNDGRSGVATVLSSE